MRARVVSLVMLALPALFAGAAQADPAFVDPTAADLKDVKEVEWKAQAKAGFTLTTGNSQASNLTAGAMISRKEKANKLSVEGNIAYARSNIFVAQDLNGNGLIDSPAELQRVATTTTNQWNAKARYDRFFTESDAAYILGDLAADKVAGKDLGGGGQIGYSRHLYKDDQQDLVGEIGYDLAYEKDVAAPNSVIIHSARLFVGDQVKLNDSTSFFGNVEMLFNLNTETNALQAAPGYTATTGVDAFKDTRFNAKIGLTTHIWKNLSFTFSYTVKYDESPAPLPAPAGTMFAATFVPFADKLDTLTEAALVIDFL